MKASEFKQLIKEAVKEAIREEMNAVQQPVQEVRQTPPAPKKTGNPITDMINETAAAMNTQDYRNVIGADSSMSQGFSRSMFMPKPNATPMSSNPEIVAHTVAHAPKVGIDLSQFSFVNKASAIVKASDEKDKLRNGL